MNDDDDRWELLAAIVGIGYLVALTILLVTGSLYGH